MAAGGGTDAVCRKVSDLAGKSLGQDVIIDNRPGAGGGVGVSFLAKSKPDGYTIGAASSAIFTVLPFFTKMDFDPLADLTPIVQTHDIYSWLVVAADSPIKNFKDFLEEGKKRQLLVACTGMTFVDIVMEYLGSLAKINVKMVPFGGSSQCVVPLLGGKVDAIVNSGLQEFVKAGKMRYIARMTEGVPPKEYKDVPHVKEFGFDVNAPGFAAIFGPKGLPKEVQARLEQAYTRAALDPSIKELIDKLGQTPSFRNSKDLGSFTKQAYELGRRVIKESGLGIYGKEKK